MSIGFAIVITVAVFWVLFALGSLVEGYDLIESVVVGGICTAIFLALAAVVGALVYMWTEVPLPWLTT